jgi:hypothetical protein
VSVVSHTAHFDLLHAVCALVHVAIKARCSDPRCVLTPTLRAEVDAAVSAAGLAKNAGDINVFVSSGLHAMSGGSLVMGTGAAVGVPRTFLCDAPDHPLLASLRLHGEHVGADGGDDEAHRVRELLVRSPQCRGFALAHELGHVAREDALLSVGLWSGATAGATRGVVGAMRNSNPVRGVVAVLFAGAAVVLGRWGMEVRADAFARRCGYVVELTAHVSLLCALFVLLPTVLGTCAHSMYLMLNLARARTQYSWYLISLCCTASSCCTGMAQVGSSFSNSAAS